MYMTAALGFKKFPPRGTQGIIGVPGELPVNCSVGIDSNSAEPVSTFPSSGNQPSRKLTATPHFTRELPWKYP